MTAEAPSPTAGSRASSSTWLRRGPWLFLALFAVVALATFVFPAPASAQRALRYFSAEELSRAQRYGLPLRALSWASRGLSLALLAALVATPLARRLAERCAAIARRRFLPTLLLVGLSLALGEALALLPLELAGFAHERAWGVTHRGLGAWLAEWARGLAVGLPLGAIALVAFYLVLRYMPRAGYLVAAAGAVALSVAGSALAPVYLAPLFNDFRPLRETRWAALEPDVRALCARSGVTVRDVLVMDASRQGSHTNAYFAGVGATRRIVLYDTLLASHPRAEVLSVLAHELGHWRHHHEARGLALGGVLALLFALALWRVLPRAVGRAPARLAAPWDPAGLPLVLLLLSAGGFVAAPVTNAVSRGFEQQADDDALDLGGDAAVFVASERRLVIDNHADPAPNALRVFLGASHPTPLARIERACARQPSACAGAPAR